MSGFLPRGLRTACALSAITALFAASAVAKPQPASIPDPAVMPAAAFPQCQLWCAVINSDGTINRAHLHTTASHLATGEYQVLFYNSISSQKDITKCAFTATVGVTGFSGSEPATFITLAGRAGTSNGVYVATYDQTGAAVDAPFHLLVSC
jgi:hypothetical protein